MSRRKGPDILYEDDDILVVNKPSDLLSIPGRDADVISLLTILQSQYQEIFTVHRLDKDTSGVLVFAKHAEAHRHLSLQFTSRDVRKVYLAIVHGRPTTDEFTIDAKLAVDKRGLAIVSRSGKIARTHCRVLESFTRFSYLRIEPDTGRQHQIRVHLAHHGHPLAVDPLYGTAKPLTIADIKQRASFGKWVEEPTPLLIRTPLHAGGLTFTHPGTGKIMTVEAELPKDMEATLRQLRKWSR